jgi:hypothetical protein
VRLHSYETDGKCATCNSFQQPGCCDDFDNTRTCTGTEKCDNTFFYCLRPKGTVEPHNTDPSRRCEEGDRFGMLSSINIDSAPLNFTHDYVMGLPNPVPLCGTNEWKVHQRENASYPQLTVALLMSGLIITAKKKRDAQTQYSTLLSDFLVFFTTVTHLRHVICCCGKSVSLLLASYPLTANPISYSLHQRSYKLELKMNSETAI